MAIKAVVLDIGSVLEVIDDSVFPGPWEERLGLEPGGFGEAVDGLAGDAVIGAVTEHEVFAHWQQRLSLDTAQAAEMADDFWRWYVGTLDRELFDWFAGLRPRIRTGILSNSGPGARERERCHGFEAITDDIVYSHEVGLKKPDPAIYALTASRLAVLPHEIAFLDDVPENVEAAGAQGWHAVLHTEGDAASSISSIERIVADNR